MTPPPLALLLLLAALPACTATVGGDGRSLGQHNDELRRSNQQLQQQVEETRRQIVRLEQELKAHRDPRRGGTGPADAVAPTLVGVRFARYTGPIDTDGDGVDDTLRLYLRPLDQRGRMLVVGGTFNVQVTRLAADAPPQVLLDRTFAPDQVDRAYRTGLTGDHYAFELPLTPDTLGDARQITVLVTVDAAGQVAPVAEQAAFPLQR